MNQETSIEKRMDLERVSETELANVLYVCKTAMDVIKEQEKEVCDCENCREQKKNEQKILKLRKYKQKLGLMSQAEEHEFERSLKLKETNKKMLVHLEGFYAKMAPHLSNERRIELESDLDF